MTIPANTQATVYIPAANQSVVKESGKQANTAQGVKFIRYENGQAVYEVSSGSNHFTR